jgi:hypothetical protein
MRIFNGCFTAIFMAMIMLPLVFVDLKSDRVSFTENRMLAERPKLADIREHPWFFAYCFEKWFNDHTGFRERLIKLYQVIDKNEWLEAVHYTDGQYVYIIGEQGHHYFAGGGELIFKFQGKQFLSDEQISRMAEKLEEVKTYLDGKDIPLVVMFCTDKESVYPEYYTKSIKWGAEPIQLDIITNYLQNNTSVDVFNIRQALLAEKENYLLYNISSGDLTHYTEIGAFFAYRELMKHINIHFPDIVSYELNDIDISYDGLTVSLKTEKAYKKLDGSFFEDVEFNGTVFKNFRPDLPVILFLHDSYAGEQYIGKYFAQSFGKAIFIHYANLGYFEEIIDRYKPDIVVFESAERQLGWFANCVMGIPELSH